MKQSYRLLMGIILLLFQLNAIAQQKADSNIFRLSDLKELVLRHHPIVKQAALLSDGAQAKVLQALGKFDPKLEAAFAQKEFGNTDYYTNFQSELKVPLWLAGADLKVGFDRNVGPYTTRQYQTPDDGLTGVGVNVPLGQGFLFDARRNTLQQARIMTRYADAERAKQIISVWYRAVQDYWNWYYAYMQFQLIDDGVVLARTRYEAIKAQTELGDKPGIDSVEAGITVQDREMQLAKLTVELENTRLLLSNHIWNEQEQPLELSANLVPERDSIIDLREDIMAVDSLIYNATGNHPELVKIRTKEESLSVEQRYQREMLKPRLNLSGTLLTSRNTFGSFSPEYYDFRWQNYKVGIDFSFPLFLRAERGKLKEIKLKRMELDYDLKQTEREITNDIFASYNMLGAYHDQLEIQVSSINNQSRLLQAENQKFQLGESTLFLINSRETKLIEMQMKRAQLVADYQKKIAELYYKAGTM